jgi:hypothetical protein
MRETRMRVKMSKHTHPTGSKTAIVLEKTTL